MTINFLTLRQCFGETFTGKNAVDLDALLAMIERADSFNDDAYSLSETDIYETTSDGKYFVLYSKSTDSDGNEVFTAIATPDTFIPSSVDLYLKVKNASGTDPSNYVQIYTLKKLDVTKFRSGEGYLSRYRDTAARVAAMLYALCCLQKLLMQRYINDIEAVNREQKALNRISSLLSVLQNDLREKDTGVEDVASRHASTIYADIMAFFVQRGLLDTASNGSVINSTTTTTLKNILLGIETNDSRSISLPDSVCAWMQLQTLVRHYDTFWGTGENRFLPSGVTDSGDLNLDPYSSDYWVRASDSENNTFKGVVAFGDHWVFDPRIRKKDGTLLTQAGGQVYFKGFSAVNTGKNCENYARMYDADGNDVGGTAPTTDIISPEYSVSWFGKNPPTSAADFESGIAGILSRPYGKAYFIPTSKFFEDGPDGRKKFTDEFKNAITNGDTSLTIRFCKKDSRPYYFYINNFAGETIPNSDLPGGTSENISSTIGACKGLSPSKDYWPMPGGSGAYADLKWAIENATDGVKLNAEHCGMWADTLRVYTDQVNNDTTGRSTNMQMVLQLSQQDLSTASNLMKAIFRTYTEVVGNIRL
ncbi:MAG: hypothetical protein LBB26_02895 [Puniceicoccales bacterium]|jgi:type II secretory pathway pseudopilin PulG|nr:hypothetical protein [Puniceicoccales bacterium]